MRLLQVIAPAPFGGAESVARAIAATYPDETTLVTLLQMGGPHPFAEQVRADGLEQIELSCGRRRYDREARELARIVGRGGYDVVHTHIYHADFVGWWAARRNGIPVVASVHGITGGDRKDRFYQWLDLKLLPHFDALICVSESVRQRVLAAGAAEERVHLVRNPYVPVRRLSRADARSTLGLPPEGPVIGWIGRVNIEKGPDLFLRALAAMGPERPLAVFLGSGPELERTRALASTLGLADGVRFAGDQPNAAALVTAFDLLSISSRTEGLPMTLLEAMGARVPVAAFAVGGIPDAVDERTAWLAPPEDVGGLARAMADALAAPDESTRRAERAHEVVTDRFGASAWMDRIRSIYRAVVLERGQGADSQKSWFARARSSANVTVS